MPNPKRLLDALYGGAKAAKSAPKQVPSMAGLSAQERAENLAKFLEPSAVQMRLYHGTTATEGGKGQEAIRQFKPSKEGALGSGVYMTPKADYAGYYALNTPYGAPPSTGGNVLPVYAQMRNPLVISGEGDPMIEALVKLGLDENKASRLVERAYENKGYIGKEVETRAKAAGYDGLMQYRDGELAEVVSYNPSAIKSALGNEGTYNTSVPLLNKAEGGAVHMQGGGDVTDKPLLADEITGYMDRLNSRDSGSPLSQFNEDLTILPEEDTWDLLKGLDRIYTPKIGEYIADVQSPAELLGRIKDLDPEYVDALTSGLSELISQTQPMGPNSFDSVPKYHGSDPLDKLNRQEIDEAAWQVYENPALASTFVNVLQNPLAYTMTESAVDQPRDIKAEIWNEEFPKWKEDLLGAPADIQPLTKSPEDEELGSSYQGLTPLAQARFGNKGQQQYRTGGAVHMQDGGRLPPGIKRATERAKESKSVLPVAGARQARQAIQGYLGMDPSFSVMDPEAQALESAYRGGETASVLGDLFASLTPFATASALSKANQVPGLAELIAYHGSPHKFKKFDASKIGTGEGAQAYGHGLYFAENPAVAKDYRKELATEVTIDGKPYFTGGRKVSSTGDKTIDDFLTWHVGDVAKAIEAAKRMGFDEYIPKLEALKDRVKRVQGGALYTVDIPDEKIAQMLDWDKPLSQQPVAMQVARKVFNDPQRKSAGFPSITDEEIGNLTGQDLYRAMTTTRGGLQPGASKSLLQEGIPGIQYLDQVSRNKPLKDIKREFLNELPENASIDEVVELLGTGTFSPKNEAIIKELAANDWLGFDYPAQSLSTVLSPSARNYDLSPSLMRAINEAQEGGTRNFVVFPGEEQNIKMLDINGEPQMAAGGAVSTQNNRKVRISDNLDTMLLELMSAPKMQAGGSTDQFLGRTVPRGVSALPGYGQGKEDVQQALTALEESPIGRIASGAGEFAEGYMSGAGSTDLQKIGQGLSMIPMLGLPATIGRVAKTAKIAEPMIETAQTVAKPIQQTVKTAPKSIAEMTAEMAEKGKLNVREPSSLPGQVPSIPTFNNIQPITTVQLPSGQFATTTGFSTVKPIRTGFDVAETPEQVAHLTAGLRKSPQEQVVAVVVDENNKPIQIIRHTIGLINEASTEPFSLVGSIANTPGAKGFYISHNHPSGISELSTADQRLADALNNLTKDTGLEMKGMLAVGKNKFGYYDPVSKATTKDQAIPAAVRNKSIDMVERTLKKTQLLDQSQLDSPQAAARFADKFAGDQTGILLLNNQQYPVGFLPIDPSQFANLRKSGTSNSILKALEKANSNKGVLITKENIKPNELENIEKFFNASYVRMLDAILGPKRESAHLKGSFGRTSSTDFLSVAPVAAGLGAAAMQEDEYKKGGRVHISNNPDTMRLELLRKKHA